MSSKVAHRGKIRKVETARDAGGLAERWRKFARDATTGQFTALTPVDLKQSWSKRFAVEEIEALVIARRTLARRKARHEKLSMEETGRAMRLARVTAEADRVFANSKKADHWLRTPNARLAGQSPLSVLKTEAGAFVVEEMLGQIEHGIYV
ncbi:MAG: antitoxin Xre/MbcA/ParS toxin-binding domain-containing protein [Aestuariivirga sp.]